MEANHGAMDFYLQTLQDEVNEAIRGCDFAKLTRPQEGKWSAAEVLEHLYLTYLGTTKSLERCLQQGQPLARAVTGRDRVRTAIVIGLGYLPTGRKSPERALPKGMPVEQVVKEITSQLAAMDEALARCEAHFGRKTRLFDHPNLGPLTARQWRKFHLVHGRHHVRQLRKLTSTGNPKS